MAEEKPSILLVEDEMHLARGICFNLEQEGYRVSHVESGEEALER
ncbi:MAG TPA: DNA-binding response regulator, partial [Geobacteraceae bacterium]